jgi:hypothetical protein
MLEIFEYVFGQVACCRWWFRHLIFWNIHCYLLTERLAFYAMCGKYKTVRDQAQAEILPHIA